MNSEEIFKVTEPKEFQRECAENAFGLICKGKRRLSVLMPTGCGRATVALLIAEKICTSYQRALLVTDFMSIARSTNDRFMRQEASFVEAVTVAQLIEEKRTADIYILDDVRPANRRKIANYLGSHNSSIVVSLMNIPSDSGAGTLEYENPITGYQVAKMPSIRLLIYSTDSILDIRDICDADEEEKKEQSDRLTADAAALVEERDRLAADVAALREEREHTLAEAMQTSQQMQRQIDLLRDQIRLLSSVIESVGISKDELERELKHIEDLRNELRDDLSLEDGSINEAVMARFETEVAESVARVMQSAMTEVNEERYEDILKDLLTEDVWNHKLCSKSRSYLITAKMNYEMMAHREDASELDFSGVCLLLTKTLDAEVARRAYSGYEEYLRERYPVPQHLHEWPSAMLNKDNSAVLEPKDFTLGTVTYVVGVKFNGNVRDYNVFNKFRGYAVRDLYRPTLTNEQVGTRLRNMVIYVEKIRKDYRNPAAHRNAMNVVTAEACMEYMLDTYKKLKEILEDMRY